MYLHALLDLLHILLPLLAVLSFVNVVVENIGKKFAELMNFFSFVQKLKISQNLSQKKEYLQ